jgi:hypothetical protein
MNACQSIVVRRANEMGNSMKKTFHPTLEDDGDQRLLGVETV